MPEPKPHYLWRMFRADADEVEASLNEWAAQGYRVLSTHIACEESIGNGGNTLFSQSVYFLLVADRAGGIAHLVEAGTP